VAQWEAILTSPDSPAPASSAGHDSSASKTNKTVPAKDGDHDRDGVQGQAMSVESKELGVALEVADVSVIATTAAVGLSTDVVTTDEQQNKSMNTLGQQQQHVSEPQVLPAATAEPLPAALAGDGWL